MDETYVSPRLQIRAIDGVLVETRPLCERLFGIHLVLLIGPFKHLLLEGQAHAGAICPDDALRVVEQVIRIDNADFCTRRRAVR